METKEEIMKIKQLFLKNFASVSEITINYNHDITYLCGNNGAGKTTVGLNAIWFILEGLSLKGKKVLHGDRFRFIGKQGKSAIGKLVLHDEIENIDITITRKLLKNKTELKITASDKRQLPADFIDDIFNIFSINPMGFAKLAPQEQAEALGVDTSENDRMKKVAYDERIELGRDVKRLKGALEEFGEVKAVEKVDIQKLLAKKDQIEKTNTKLTEKAVEDRNKKIQAIVAFNKQQADKQIVITDITKDIETKEQDIQTLRENIERLNIQLTKDIKSHETLLKQRSHMPTPDEQKSIDILLEKPDTEDTSALNQQIQTAETTNQQAILYQQGVDAENKHKVAKLKYDNKTAELQTIENNRIEYLKSCNLPFANITIDDTGGVLINDRPFSETYFSKGEILRMGIKLAASVNPKLKYVFIPDSQSIDEKNRERLFDELTEAGFQVVAEYVDTEKRKDHGSILLKESKIVESYDDSDADLNML
jgi:hypothetical protein